MAPPAPAFDTGCSHLAIATSDARVKLFGVASQRLAVDLTPALGAGAGGQSAEIFTALAWGSKGRVAVGTAAGAVRAADSTSGSAAWSTTAPGITGGVAALAHAPDCDQLVVLGATGGAAVLDSATGSAVTHFKTQQETLSAALLLSGGRAVVAGLVTVLVDVASGSRLARWAAHGAPVRALCAPASESCLVSAGEGERAAAVHSLAFGKKGKLVRKAACATIPLRAAAGALAAADAEGAAPGEAAVVVAAALRDGGLEVFLAPASAPAKDAPAAQARRVAQAPAGAGVTAVAVRRASAKAATLLVATGSSARPVFQTVTVTFPKAGEEPAALQLEREAAGGALLGDEAVRAAGRQQKAGSATPVVVVGAETVVRAGVADAGRKRAAAEAEAEPTVAGLPDIVDPEEGGPTLGERVAALEGAAAAQPAPELPARPSAGSMASLLSQALRSEDRALLERCLSVRSERVIASTARAITGGDAVLLLRALVARLGASPLRGARLAAWTRATLRAHAASLAGAPGAAGTLGVLAQQIELRMAGYQQLLSLAGRLDLVLAQTGKGRRSAGAAGDDSAPLRVEVDKDGAVAVEEVAAVNGLEEDLDASSSDDGLSSDGSGDEGDVPNGAAASEDEDEDVSASSDDEDMEE